MFACNSVLKLVIDGDERVNRLNHLVPVVNRWKGE